MLGDQKAGDYGCLGTKSQEIWGVWRTKPRKFGVLEGKKKSLGTKTREIWAAWGLKTRKIGVLGVQNSGHLGCLGTKNKEFWGAWGAQAFPGHAQHLLIPQKKKSKFCKLKFAN